MRKLGDSFEDAARQELESRGLKTLARNFSTRFGELDLVMLDGATLVFVEVRYRRHGRFGGAAASVTATKQSRLIKAAQGFLRAHPKHAARTCRFDVVTFDGPPDAPAGHWRRAAFDAF